MKQRLMKREELTSALNSSSAGQPPRPATEKAASCGSNGRQVRPESGDSAGSPEGSSYFLLGVNPLALIEVFPKLWNREPQLFTCMRSTWEPVGQGCEAEPGVSDSVGPGGSGSSGAAGLGDRTGICRVRFLHNEVTFPLLHLVSISGGKDLIFYLSSTC